MIFKSVEVKNDLISSYRKANQPKGKANTVLTYINMSNLFSIKDAEKKIAEVSIPAMATHHIKEHKQGFNKLSRLLGKPPGYIAQQLKRKNPSLPLLYALSVHLQTNFFEPFCNLLPENIRPTRQEKALQQQLTDLQKQYDDLKKERDLLKEIVMK